MVPRKQQKKKTTKKKQVKVIRKWRRLTEKLMLKQKILKDVRSASRIQNKVLQTNNFTLADEPSVHENEVRPGQEWIVTDENEDEKINQENVDVVKTTFLDLLNCSRVQKRYQLVCQLKSHLLAVIKGRRQKKKFSNLKSAAIKVQYHYRKYKKQSKSAKDKPAEPEMDEETIERMRKLEFIRKQQKLVQKKKMQKKAVIM